MEKTIKGRLVYTTQVEGDTREDRPMMCAIRDDNGFGDFQIDYGLYYPMGGEGQQVELTIKTVDKKEEAKNGE